MFLYYGFSIWSAPPFLHSLHSPPLSSSLPNDACDRYYSNETNMWSMKIFIDDVYLFVFQKAPNQSRGFFFAWKQKCQNKWKETETGWWKDSVVSFFRGSQPISSMICCWRKWYGVLRSKLNDPFFFIIWFETRGCDATTVYSHSHEYYDYNIEYISIYRILVYGNIYEELLQVTTYYDRLLTCAIL